MQRTVVCSAVINLACEQAPGLEEREVCSQAMINQKITDFSNDFFQTNDQIFVLMAYLLFIAVNYPEIIRETCILLDGVKQIAMDAETVSSYELFIIVEKRRVDII